MKKYGWIICFAFFGCGWFGKTNSRENAVARVGETYLYRSDLEGLVPPGTSAEDSTERIKNFVNSWVRQTLLLKKAELNLADDLKNFDRQLEEYRQSLIIHAYQEMVVAQYLDTVVTEEQIDRYYRENPSNFELKNNIIRADYLVFSRKNPEYGKVRGWFLSTDEAKREKLMDFCRRAALKYHVGDSAWLMMDDIEKEIPLNYASQELFLSSKKFVELEDSSLVYLLKINDYKIKESLSPLEFERDRIRSIILNKRKLELLMKVEEETFNEALEKGKFEIWVP